MILTTDEMSLGAGAKQHCKGRAIRNDAQDMRKFNAEQWLREYWTRLAPDDIMAPMPPTGCFSKKPPTVYFSKMYTDIYYTMLISS